MAAAGTVHDQCPECDVAIPISVQVKGMTREGEALIVDLEPDLTDMIAHAWTHE